MNDAIVHFTLGTCPIITLPPFITLIHAYGNLTVEEKENSFISLPTLLVSLPILVGIFLSIIYSLLGFIPRKTSDNTYLRFVLSGGLTALFMSLIFHYCFNIYEDWFDVENPNIIHICVFISYILYFYTIGQWIRYQVLYGSPVSTSSSTSPQLSVSSRGRTSTRDGTGETTFDALKKKVSS